MLSHDIGYAIRGPYSEDLPRIRALYAEAFPSKLNFDIKSAEFRKFYEEHEGRW